MQESEKCLGRAFGQARALVRRPWSTLRFLCSGVHCWPIVARLLMLLAAVARIEPFRPCSPHLVRALASMVKAEEPRSGLGLLHSRLQAERVKLFAAAQESASRRRFRGPALPEVMGLHQRASGNA